jgi:hypothetical protein
MIARAEESVGSNEIISSKTFSASSYLPAR